jgi:hypothetical protein
MAGSDFYDDFVVLGPIVPVDAYRLALDLEARGFRLHREGENTLVVEPPDRLTPADVVVITRWKWHLLMVLDYGDRPFDPHRRTVGARADDVGSRPNTPR